MEKVIEELTRIVETFANKCRELSESEFSDKPNPAKWSKKEVLGHLIDSAQNNIRRFICGQYEHTPPKIVYDQDFWVGVNSYQSESQESVIRHWELINFQIVNVLQSMPEDNYKKLADTGKDDIQLRTLEWLADDYVKHMKHHLNQIFKNSFDVVYG
jgi:hypothetical protein